jgi:hypothetical protein
MTHIPPADQRIAPEQAYALGQLHAEMMMTLENADWPVGSMHDIWVDTHTLSREERHARRKAQRERGERGAIPKNEKDIIREHAIPCRDLLFTPSGAVYQERMVGSPSGYMVDAPSELVVFATLTGTYEVETAMQAIIDYCLSPRPEGATT